VGTTLTTEVGSASGPVQQRKALKLGEKKKKAQVNVKFKSEGWGPRKTNERGGMKGGKSL